MALPKRRNEQLPDQEYLLLDYAERLRKHVVGRRAVHIHLSQLKPHNRREHHIRIAANAFQKLVHRYAGQRFQLKNCDLVVVVKDAGIAEIDEVVLKLRYLFSEDPLAHGEHDEAQQPFCTWYELEQDYEAFLAAAQALFDAYQARKQRPTPSPGTDSAAEEPEMPLQPIDPVRLGRLEEALTSMDLAPLLRRQPVCAIMPKGEVRPVFHEIFVSIDMLRARVMPDVDIASDRWLFQHLTAFLDRRLLRILPDIEANLPLASSININLATLLSEQFLQFDRELRTRTPKSFVLELQSVDIFADMGAYMFARDFVRERGYKVCLDGLSHLTFPMVRRDDLGVDLEKIQWSPDVIGDVHAARREQFRQAIRRAGPARVVLCRCDGPEAIKFGQSLGITLFQGRYVDQLLTRAAADAALATAERVSADLTRG